MNSSEGAQDLKQFVEGSDGIRVIRGSGNYIEPGVPHEVLNMSDSEPVVAVVARSDATEWENIVPYDRHSER